MYPTWDVVLKHLHWTKEVERIGNEFLRKLLGASDHEDTPPVGPHGLHEFANDADTLPLVHMLFISLSISPSTHVTATSRIGAQMPTVKDASHLWKHTPPESLKFSKS